MRLSGKKSTISIVAAKLLSTMSNDVWAELLYISSTAWAGKIPISLRVIHKQIFEVRICIDHVGNIRGGEFRSSLKYIQKPVPGVEGGRMNASPSHPHAISQLIFGDFT
jgi:hypothetical protein